MDDDRPCFYEKLLVIYLFFYIYSFYQSVYLSIYLYQSICEHIIPYYEIFITYYYMFITWSQREGVKKTYKLRTSNIGILNKIINPLTLGQIKLFMDPVNKNPNFFLYFLFVSMHNRTCVKIIASAKKSSVLIMLWSISKDVAWLVDFRTESQIWNFQMLTELYSFIWRRVRIFVIFCIFTNLNLITPCREHVVNMMWTCCDHFMNMLWIFHEHIVNISWTCCEHVLNMSWPCCEIVGILSRKYREHVVNMS